MWEPSEKYITVSMMTNPAVVGRNLPKSRLRTPAVCAVCGLEERKRKLYEQARVVHKMEIRQNQWDMATSLHVLFITEILGDI
jgi:hypothetical protein